MKPSTFLFVNLNPDYVDVNRSILEEYLDPVLERVSFEMRVKLVPKIQPDCITYRKEHRFLCFKKYGCTCKWSEKTIHTYCTPIILTTTDVQWIKTTVPLPRWTPPENADKWSSLRYNDTIIVGACDAGPSNYTTRALVSAFWESDTETVIMSEDDRNMHRGVVLWTPLENGMYEWAHTFSIDNKIRMQTGLGRIMWNGTKGTLFRITRS